MLFWNRWNQESAGRVYFNISREKPAHTPDTPHVQPLSCKLEWTNQKHFYCFLLKPIRGNLAPGFPRALDLSPLQAQKSSRSRLMGTVYQIFLPMVLRCVCFARARGLRYKTIKHATSPKLPPWVAWKGKNQNFQRILRVIFKKRNVTQMRM